VSLAITLTAGLVWAQSKDSTTINGVTFDFGAPAPPLTPAQQAFYQRYRSAVNARDESALLALEDSSRSGCKYSGGQLLLRDFRRPIPENAKVRFFSTQKDLAKAFGFGDVAYLSIEPTATLGISFASSSGNHVSSAEILRPVRQSGDSITIVPYCLTEKGQHLLEQKTQSGK
jgi:hypothetical protein